MTKNSDNSSVAFKEAYQRLNQAQKEAVDSIEGPVMVVAGPGTGKTQILTLRIANILLKTDTPPDSILALTFTESGAKAMRERLRQYIGATAYQVPIFTFHGFSKTLISAYPDAYDRVIGGRPAGDIDKINIIESIVEAGQIKLLRPMGNPAYYVKPLLHIISDLKQEYVTPDVLVELVNQQEESLSDIEQYHTKGAHKGKVRGEYSKLEKSIAKNRELIHVYRSYEALLSKQNLYDFEDMIIETVKALESNEEMLLDLQERYQYILADEHQDVNGSQNKILELLSSFHEAPNIFAVGDEKQAIYRFQGASLENFLYFTEQFPGTKVISLTDNYRSGQTLLDAAHSLVAVEEGPLKDLRIPLEAKAVSESAVERREFSHQAVEDDWVVSEVKAELQNGTPASEIAVILRTNREVEALTNAIRKAGVPATASAEGDILTHPITEAVRNLIELVLVEKSEEALFRVLHGVYWGIGPNDLLRLFSARSYKSSLWSLLSNEKRLKELDIDDPSAFLRVKEVVNEARSMEVHEAPHRVLEFLIQKSGLLDHLIANDPFEGTRVVRRLYDEIEELVLQEGVSTLREVSDIFSTRQSYGLPLNAPYIATRREAVQVMTAHKSKGLEFSVVFLPHLTDSGWSGGNKRKNFDIPLQSHFDNAEHEIIEDERRLLYVAMTRAKKKLSVSLSGLNADGRDLLPARLLEEVSSDFVSGVETVEEEEGFQPAGSLTGSAETPVIDPELLRDLLEERGFSATSLNNYLKSPWDYLYRNVLRIPETQPVHMQYGTAVHNTLEFITHNHTKEGKLPNTSAVKRRLEQELNRLPLTTEEYNRLLEKGLEELTVYIEHLKKTLPKETKEEVSFKVTLETGISELPELSLTGKLDRVDFDETGKVARVVDYKTGKPKTRNVIEGKTKGSDGGYKRQLVFYMLLLRLYDDERYQTREGVLSFVQPDGKGNTKEESFTITDEEIDELKETIIKSVKEIITGSFLGSPCDAKDSDYCQLVELLKARQ